MNLLYPFLGRPLFTEISNMLEMDLILTASFRKTDFSVFYERLKGLHTQKAYTHTGTFSSQCIHQTLCHLLMHIHLSFCWPLMHTHVCMVVADCCTRQSRALTDGQTDERTLPNTLSPCFTKLCGR